MSSETAPLEVTPIEGGYRMNFRGSVQSQPEFLRAEMDKIVKASPKQVVWDLSGIEMIASAGLGILVQCRNRIRESGAELKTVAVHPRVLEILQISALDKVFNVKLQ